MFNMDISKEKCRYCGEQAKNFQFAAFICDKDECARKAMEDRGGPHKGEAGAGGPLQGMPVTGPISMISGRVPSLTVPL